MGFPLVRMRRLRQSVHIREMVRETSLAPDDFILREYSGVSIDYNCDIWKRYPKSNAVSNLITTGLYIYQSSLY